MGDCNSISPPSSAIIVHKSAQLTPFGAPAVTGSKVALTLNTHKNQTLADILGDKLPNKKRSPLKQKAQAKWVSNSIAIQILNTCKDTKLRKMYLRTLGCNNTLLREGNTLKAGYMEWRVTGKARRNVKEFQPRYCNSRLCIICNHIRTAKRIDAYLDEIVALPEKFFIVLSRPNVPGADLKKEIRTQYETIRQIKKKCTKQKLKLRGLRSYETTVNAKDGSFHPHWHFLVSGKKDAEKLLELWLEYFPTAQKDKGNKLFPYDEEKGHRKVLLEMFKYQCKLLTPVKDKQGRQIDAISLNTIFEAVAGMRTFQPMGVRKKGDTDTEDANDGLQIQTYEELAQGDIQQLYVWNGNDWYATDTGESLSDYEPPPNLRNSIINNST